MLGKTVDVKTFGYEKVLEPLLKDLKTLEEEGVYVPFLGKSLKGTVHSVITDNFVAHGIAGFIESFSGEYFCRVCVAKSSEIRHNCVVSGVFKVRSKESHNEHVNIVARSSTHYFRVKRECKTCLILM